MSNDEKKSEVDDFVGDVLEAISDVICDNAESIGSAIAEILSNIS
jgi:hypothetical protein